MSRLLLILFMCIALPAAAQQERECRGKRVAGKRLKTICKTFLPALQAELAGQKYSRIVVAMVWPRVENTGTYVAKDVAKVAVQHGFSSAQCRGIRFFG